jgi:hypothetical protein
MDSIATPTLKETGRFTDEDDEFEYSIEEVLYGIRK